MKKDIYFCIQLIVLICLFSSLVATPSAMVQAADLKAKRPDSGWVHELLQADPMDNYLPGLEMQSNGNQPATDYPSAWQKIVYQEYYKNWEIYKINPDGSGWVQLTKFKKTDVTPSYRKDAQQVAFVSSPKDNPEIFKINSDGSGAVQLTNDPASDSLPAWSPDGTKIAFQSLRTGSADIFVMNADGSNLKQLTFESSYDGEVAWSPGGKQIIFVSNRSGTYDLWIMNSDGSSPHAITSGKNTASPSWSPDGKEIAYSWDDDNSGYYAIYVMNIDGSSSRKITTKNPPTMQWKPVWSPDGKNILYIQTALQYYNGYWYWSTSVLYIYNFFYTSSYTPVSSTTVWKADWGAEDTQVPGPCTLKLYTDLKSGYAPFSFSGQDEGPSGVMGYGLQYMHLPDTTWIDDSFWTSTNGGLYKRPESETINLRCRLFDAAGNVGPWGEAVAITGSRISGPISNVSAPAFASASSEAGITVSGQDINSKLTHIDVWMRDGNQGDWSLWKSLTKPDATTFSGAIGHTYYFRSQAYDSNGFIEPWSPVPEATVTFYGNRLSGKVTDVRDNVISGSGILLTPSPLGQTSTLLIGTYEYYLDAGSTYTLSMSSGGVSPLPDTPIAPSSTTILDLVLPASPNQVINGHFENSLTGWAAAGAAVTKADSQHTGLSGLQLGAAASISQTVQIGQASSSPTLSFLYRIPTDLTPSAFSVKIQGSSVITTIISASFATNGWQHVWADLSSFAGQTITLTLSSYGPAGAVDVDEVFVGSWQTPVVPHLTFLPQAITSSTPVDQDPGPSWAVFGNNNQHTGYASEEIGASRYSLAWSYSEKENVFNLKPIAVAEGVALARYSNYNYPNSSYLIAFDATSGKTLWYSDSSLSYDTDMPAVAYGMAIFPQPIDSVNNKIVARDLHNGNLIWASDLIAGEYLGPVVDGGYAYLESLFSNLSAVNLGSGQTAWSTRADYDTNPSEEWTPAFYKGVLYTYTYDGKLRAYDPVNGSVLWTLPLVDYFGNTILFTAPVIADDKAFLASRYRLHAVNLSTHSILWSVEGNFEQTTPAVADRVIYVNNNSASNNARIEARSMADGSVLWSYSVGEKLKYAPIIAGDYVYTSSYTHTYIINRKTHQLASKIDQGGWLVMAGGLLYISGERDIFAYRAQEP